MLESLRLGRMPIVVPRRQQFGEAVDDHQLEFSRFLLRCPSRWSWPRPKPQLRAALDRALADPDAFDAPLAPASWVSSSAAVQRFSDFARQLPPRRRGRLLLQMNAATRSGRSAKRALDLVVLAVAGRTRCPGAVHLHARGALSVGRPALLRFPRAGLNGRTITVRKLRTTTRRSRRNRPPAARGRSDHACRGAVAQDRPG